MLGQYPLTHSQSYDQKLWIAEWKKAAYFGTTLKKVFPSWPTRPKEYATMQCSTSETRIVPLPGSHDVLTELLRSGARRCPVGWPASRIQSGMSGSAIADWAAVDGPRKAHRAGTHRLVAPEHTIARVRHLMPVMGVTRIANITGLDCIGIPVVVVTRPNSRSLSCC